MCDRARRIEPRAALESQSVWPRYSIYASPDVLALITLNSTSSPMTIILLTALSGVMWGALAHGLEVAHDLRLALFAGLCVSILMGFIVKLLRDIDWPAQAALSLVGLYIAVFLFAVVYQPRRRDLRTTTRKHRRFDGRQRLLFRLGHDSQRVGVRAVAALVCQPRACVVVATTTRAFASRVQLDCSMILSRPC